MVEGTDWGKEAKDKWEAMEKAVLRNDWRRSVNRDQDYGRG